MLALCLMLFATYYALNYAGIIGRGLPTAASLLHILSTQQVSQSLINLGGGIGGINEAFSTS